MSLEVPTRAQKRTFSLRDSLIRALDQMVSEGYAPSKNALVERAIKQQFVEFRQARRASMWQAAARDPQFLGDISQIERQFSRADEETLRQSG